VPLAVWFAMLAGARVLVADDDPELLDAVADALGRLGAHVTRAKDGAELIEHLAEQGPFDLVVTDIAMPWMTGLRAMHAARGAGLGTPVILITALREKWIPARVKALGDSAALVLKPFDLTELESVASTMLAQSRVPARLKGQATVPRNSRRE
jgi:two-component system, NtrC family, response regulator AtoC